mmetsp:Transcript_48180/g.95414  ORF Transcript_48180/g.95414 Transcript_48180/m.95414 type:complete len:119 (-) Transcript_48180:114-470(-)
MLTAARAARVLGTVAPRTVAGGGLAVQAARPFSSGIKILEDAGHARENMYWHQEDERLLKKMIENNPSLDPNYAGLAGIIDDSSHTVADQVKLIFMKHGIPPINKALINDIVALVENK